MARDPENQVWRLHRHRSERRQGSSSTEALGTGKASLDGPSSVLTSHPRSLRALLLWGWLPAQVRPLRDIHGGRGLGVGVVPWATGGGRWRPGALWHFGGFPLGKVCSVSVPPTASRHAAPALPCLASLEALHVTTLQASHRLTTSASRLAPSASRLAPSPPLRSLSTPSSLDTYVHCSLLQSPLSPASLTDTSVALGLCGFLTVCPLLAPRLGVRPSPAVPDISASFSHSYPVRPSCQFPPSTASPTPALTPGPPASGHP